MNDLRAFRWRGAFGEKRKASRAQGWQKLEILYNTFLPFADAPFIPKELCVTNMRKVV